MPDDTSSRLVTDMAELPRRWKLPTGGETVWVDAALGGRLRAMLWPMAGARGSVLVVPGRTEFIEKYGEVIHDLLDRRYAVGIYDPYNHGLSPRPLANPHKHHAISFAPLITDLETVMASLTNAGLPQPLTLLAHSMGGHVALHALARQPDLAPRAILTAPMVGIRLAPLMAWLAQALGRVTRGGRQAQRYAPGQGDWRGGARRLALRRLLTSDAARFAAEDALLAANPALRLGGVTLGWLDTALRSCDAFAKPGIAERITADCLFLLGGADRVVDNAAARRLAARMSSARVEDIPGARHEILRERDDLRDFAFTAIDDFLGG